MTKLFWKNRTKAVGPRRRSYALRYDIKRWSLGFLLVFLFVLPGLCGRVLFPEIESKTVFPVMVRELLPELFAAATEDGANDN